MTNTIWKLIFFQRFSKCMSDWPKWLHFIFTVFWSKNQQNQRKDDEERATCQEKIKDLSIIPVK